MNNKNSTKKYELASKACKKAREIYINAKWDKEAGEIEAIPTWSEIMKAAWQKAKEVFYSDKIEEIIASDTGAEVTSDYSYSWTSIDFFNAGKRKRNYLGTLGWENGKWWFSDRFGASEDIINAVNALLKIKAA